MGTVFDPRERDWRTIERSGAEAVDGYELLPLEQGGRTRLSLTRIAAGGTFGSHIDEYAHVFCVLEGRGEVMLGKQRAQIELGKRADIAVFDLSAPHVGIVHDPVVSLVTAARGPDVKHVLVDGRPSSGLVLDYGELRDEAAGEVSECERAGRESS